MILTSCGFPIIWDTGASVCVSHDKNDFVSFSDTIGNIVKSSSLGGLAKHSKVKVEGEGFVVWYMKDVNNRYRAMKLPCAYIPKSQVRLLSTSVLNAHFPGEEFVIRGDQAALSGIKGDVLRSEILVDKDVHSNLLVSKGCLNSSIDAHINFFVEDPTVLEAIFNVSAFPSLTPCVSDINMNLSDAQKELLRWHQRLGHISFAKVKHLLQSGALASLNLQEDYTVQQACPHVPVPNVLHVSMPSSAVALLPQGVIVSGLMIAMEFLGRATFYLVKKCLWIILCVASVVACFKLVVKSLRRISIVVDAFLWTMLLTMFTLSSCKLLPPMPHWMPRLLLRPIAVIMVSFQPSFSQTMEALSQAKLLCNI
jgi:hypothetical protein